MQGSLSHPSLLHSVLKPSRSMAHPTPPPLDPSVLRGTWGPAPEVPIPITEGWTRREPAHQSGWLVGSSLPYQAGKVPQPQLWALIPECCNDPLVFIYMFFPFQALKIAAWEEEDLDGGDEWLC